MCSLELSLYLLIIKMKHFFCPGSRLFLFCCNEINLVSFITLTPSTFLPLNPRFIRIIIIYVGHVQTALTHIYEDNLACISMSVNPVRRNLLVILTFAFIFVGNFILLGLPDPVLPCSYRLTQHREVMMGHTSFYARLLR